MYKAVLFMLVMAPLLIAGKSLTNELPPPDGETELTVLAQREFIGADRCRTCHRKEDQGEQHPLWMKSKHAKAFETLGTAQAKKIAAEKGISDPQTAAACLECHTTAFGVDKAHLGDKFTLAEGVSCEACHGPGGDYYKKSTMEGIARGEIAPASVGLIKPDEKSCRTCHNEKSPTFKAFDFEKAKKDIAHPVPSAKRAEYK
jgi:hypothetical protein